MLNFFRRIRRNLLDRDGLRKPASPLGRFLFYAIGEIFLVVVGLLIALQINNWNENNQQKSTIDTFLVNLKEDLQNDISNMAGLKRSNLFKFYSMQYLLRMANEKNYDPTLDQSIVPKWEKGNPIWKQEIPEKYDSIFIHLAFLWTHRSRSSMLNMNTIEELKSTGVFSQIPNPALKKAINDYYKMSGFAIEQSLSLNKEDIRNWQNSLLKDGVVNSDPYIINDPIALIKNNPERAGLIRQLMRNAAWLIEGSDRVSNAAMELIQFIEKEVPDSKN